MLELDQSAKKWSVVGGWMDGWVGGWMGVKAGLRIAYSNQKQFQIDIKKFEQPLLKESKKNG